MFFTLKKIATMNKHFLPISAMLSAMAATAQERPLNIVYIMCDDHSYQTISAYGSTVNHTPNIDRLAERGVRFTNSFVANSLSGPSRACMLTGKHSHANGFTDNTKRFDGSQQTFPKLLRQAGYQTAMIGKWHLVSLPTGFDYWDILTGQGDYYNPTFIRSTDGDTDHAERLQRHGYSTNITTDLALDWLSRQRDPQKPFCLFIHHKAPHRTWMPDLQDLELFSDSTYELPSNFYDDYSGRRAAQEQRMTIARDMDLVYDLKMADRDSTIHSFDTTLEQWGRAMYTQRMDSAQQAAWDQHYQPIIEKFKSDNLQGDDLVRWKFQQYMRDYLRVIHSVDRNVGRVIDYLKDNGLLENTLIVYTSDQGFYMGEHGWFDKRFMYEESFRTPLIMSLPAAYGGKQGITSDAMVQNIDYAPTFLEAAGVAVPSDIQGESMLSEIKKMKASKKGSSRDRMNETTKAKTRALYYHYYEYPDEHRVNRHFGIRTKRYSLMRFYGDVNQWELYDLKRDPQNMHNIYGKLGTLSLTRKLKKQLLQLQELYDDPIRLTVDD
ncbi:MAG: sulfatase [Bacteroidaceae bacterium]|nr:sulfatase [Bacteroidaceae bacterium]